VPFDSKEFLSCDQEAHYAFQLGRLFRSRLSTATVVHHGDSLVPVPIVLLREAVGTRTPAPATHSQLNIQSFADGRRGRVPGGLRSRGHLPTSGSDPFATWVNLRGRRRVDGGWRRTPAEVGQDLLDYPVRDARRRRAGNGRGPALREPRSGTNASSTPPARTVRDRECGWHTAQGPGDPANSRRHAGPKRGAPRPSPGRRAGTLRRGARRVASGARDRGQGTMRSARKRRSNRTNISSLSTTAWKPCRCDLVTFDITSQSQLNT
jgi:hypothetical protein